MLHAVIRACVIAICVTWIAESTIAQQADVRMVGVEGEGAKYWPVWRGPTGQGTACGKLS